MPAEAGAFEAFYAGPVQHPILLWAAALAAYAVCASLPGVRPSVRRYCAALTVLSLTDAWLTANHVYGLGSLPEGLAGIVPLFFVLAGDFRYLLLAESATAAGEVAPTARGVVRAAGLTVLVPVFSQVVLWLLPESLSAPRVLYLVYELAFAALVVGLIARHPQVRALPWLRRVSFFVLLYYGLWASADAILLATGSDWGFALRVVPNVLYYGGLIAVIAAAAPRSRAAG